MGRQAKLRKNRAAAEKSPKTQEQSDSTQFVRQLNRQGYNLQEIQHSPEIPDSKVDPQV
ncbi:hypothetical protein IQ249_17420 [Lusitaniella coriacea LEGE 07157]|uniref:Uncharacterized protein n=1 Tax=Lusitaniella coriacea LEGE 07157 TaxID=945747 RepID=A0A8J7J4V0_9CYAN|nr:hypothetical protein [Lusitaniella coriacea]MBE9117679.1 hypothetical protein [Lusitaniella coriacea LEGE 07157]